MLAIDIGAFIGGIALSLYFPQIILLTGLSVPKAMIATAVSLLICAQNIGQILCPYAINPLTGLFSNGSNVQVSKMYIAMIGFRILTVITFIYALRKTRRAPGQ